MGQETELTPEYQAYLRDVIRGAVLDLVDQIGVGDYGDNDEAPRLYLQHLGNLAVMHPPAQRKFLKEVGWLNSGFEQKSQACILRATYYLWTNDEEGRSQYELGEAMMFTELAYPQNIAIEEAHKSGLLVMYMQAALAARRPELAIEALDRYEKLSAKTRENPDARFFNLALDSFAYSELHDRLLRNLRRGGLYDVFQSRLLFHKLSIGVSMAEIHSHLTKIQHPMQRAVTQVQLAALGFEDFLAPAREVLISENSGLDDKERLTGSTLAAVALLPDFERAQEFMETSLKVIQRNPDLQQVRYLYAWVFNKLAETNAKPEASSGVKLALNWVYEHAIQKLPKKNHPGLYKQYAMALFAFDPEPAEALVWGLADRQERDQRRFLLQKMGSVHVDRGNFQEARRVIDQIEQMDRDIGGRTTDELRGQLVVAMAKKGDMTVGQVVSEMKTCPHKVEALWELHRLIR